MRKPSLFAPFVLATILATGVAMLWMFLAMWLIELVGPRAEPQGQVAFRLDGAPLLYKQRAGQTSIAYEDLAGQPVEIPTGEELLQFATLGSYAQRPQFYGPDTWSYRVRAFTDMRNQPTYWYLIADGQPQGSAYFVGYSAQTNQRVGFLGTRGFRPNQLPDDEYFPFSGNPLTMYHRIAGSQYWYGGAFPYQFTTSSNSDRGFEIWQLHLLGDDHRLYQIDLKEHSVKMVFSAPQLTSCGLYPHKQKDKRDSIELAVGADREVLLLDKEYKVQRRYQLPTEALGMSFDWTEVAPGEAILYWNDGRGTGEYSRLLQILWFDQAGKVTRRETISYPDLSSPNLAMALAAPIPFLDILGVVVFNPLSSFEESLSGNWPQAISNSLKAYWRGLLAACLLSTLLSVCCYRRELRYATSSNERIAWPVFVWLGGLPAWIAYRYGRRWPVLERCPSCGKTVPRDRVPCAKCQQEFARPAREGIEILAS